MREATTQLMPAIRGVVYQLNATYMSNTLHSIQLGVGHTAVCIMQLHFIEDKAEVKTFAVIFFFSQFDYW